MGLIIPSAHDWNNDHNPMKISAMLLLLSFPVLAVAQTAVPVDREPGHHLALDNKYTRVFQVEVPPHQSTLLHQHDRDYLFVVIGPAAIENDVQDKPPVHVKFQDGEARFVKGGFAHVAKNEGDTPFRNVTIEVKKKSAESAAPKQPERGVNVGMSGGLSDVLWDNDTTRASDVQINPGGMMEKTEHKLPYLTVAVTDLDLRNDVAGRKQPEMIRLKPGDFSWSGPGTSNMLMNEGKKPARFIVIEFK